MKEEVNGGENRGIHERDTCRLTWAISGDFRLVVLGILLYSCVLRTKTRSKIAPWQVQRSFDRRICAKAMKRPQTIRSLLARALKMHRCKSVGQNRHVSLPCMPRKRSAQRGCCRPRQIRTSSLFTITYNFSLREEII